MQHPMQRGDLWRRFLARHGVFTDRTVLVSAQCFNLFNAMAQQASMRANDDYRDELLELEWWSGMDDPDRPGA